MTDYNKIRYLFGNFAKELTNVGLSYAEYKYLVDDIDRACDTLNNESLESIYDLMLNCLNSVDYVEKATQLRFSNLIYKIKSEMLLKYC